MTTIGFIGAGKMAGALAGGMVEHDSDLKLIVYDPSPASLDEFQRLIQESIAKRNGPLTSCSADSVHNSTHSGFQIAESNQQVVQTADIVFLAVKPQRFTDVMEGINFRLDRPESPLLVSVMAGVSIAQMIERSDSERVIRVMPNTPCLIGKGVLGMAGAKAVSADELEQVRGLLQPLGMVISFEERLLDAVTGLSGSGPAYVYTFIEALTQGGVAQGIPVETARQMALQTVIGATKMIEESEIHPAILREQVTSPGGTTIAGLAVLEEFRFSHAVMSAVQAATNRSRELSNVS